MNFFFNLFAFFIGLLTRKNAWGQFDPLVYNAAFFIGSW